MTTVVCDVTENADASSSVVLGFTDVLLQAAVCISLLAPGITLSVTATADALSFVSADKSFEISTTADATSTATSQLNGLELIRETADARSYSEAAPGGDALSTGNATSSVVLSRDVVVLSTAAATTPPSVSASVNVSVVETANAQSLLGEANEATLVSEANATSLVTANLLRTDTVESGAAAVSFVVGMSHVEVTALAAADATSYAISDASLNVEVVERVDASSFAVLPTRMDVWVMNTESTAMSRWTGVPVQSIAAVGGLILGAGEDGLFVMNSDTDDGAAITGSVLTGRLELGVPAIKGLSDIVVGYSSSGTMNVRVTAYSGKGSETYTYQMPKRVADAPRAGRVTPGKGLKSRYYQFEFSAADGAEFTIDTITAQVAANNRRV
jgi:hypothetical protein